MKEKEIEERLSKGEKLILKNNAYFDDWYFIGGENVENRINKNQFDKAKSTCKNYDETDKDNACFKGQSYRIYYWR